MRYIIIAKLFIKRFIKKPTFILILIAMPLMITILSKIEVNDDKGIRVGVYYENDELSKNICENLKNKNGYIKFIQFTSKNEIMNAVETNKIECGYIFPSDFKNRLDDYKIKKSITCIESPSTILSSISDEVIFAEVIEEYGKTIAADFIKNNNIGQSKDEDIFKVYERFNTPEKTFSINYRYIKSDGELSSGVGGGVITYAIHGIISVLILISGLFGAVKWLSDEKNGLYAAFNGKEKSIVGFISILVPAAIMTLSGIITIYLSNTYTNMLIESIFIILYLLLVTGFSYLIKLVVKSGTDICALLPVLTLGSLIFCPVFIDISKFIPNVLWINKIFPTFYYLNGISSGLHGFLLILIMSSAMIFIGFMVNFVKEK